MPARAVVLPGTSLLVPGAGGGADRLGDVRRVVDAALDRLVAAAVAASSADGGRDAPLVVLAPVPRGAAGGFGLRRPSLAGAGVVDRWVPDVVAWPRAHGALVPAAHLPASVALVALRGALLRAGVDASPFAVLEVSDAVEPPADGVAALSRAAAVVVAGGAPPGTPGAAAVPDPAPGDRAADPVLLAPAVSALLGAAVAPGRWSWRVTTVPGGHEHLPASYGVAEGVAG
ncbi:hypothetical protein [Isoptericola sp. NPDC019482]|uniref:hypothetical protein n=1 Tax=Isoptericola sp. NPDC019482 TaxID=3154688 RepID=UPI00346963E0